MALHINIQIYVNINEKVILDKQETKWQNLHFPKKFYWKGGGKSTLGKDCSAFKIFTPYSSGQRDTWLTFLECKLANM